MRKLIALLAMLPIVALAGDLAFSWGTPTQYTDNTPMPASAITGYDIEYGLCSTDKKTIAGTPVIVNVAPPANARTITGIGPGIWCGSVRTVTADAVSIFPVDSTTGLMAWKQIILTPKPPGNISVGGGGGIAYMAVRQADAYVMLPVGTIPGGTICDSNNAVISAGVPYYAVPSSKVQWYGSTKPTVALSPCS